MAAIDACNILIKEMASCVHLEQLSVSATKIDNFEMLYGKGKLSDSLRVCYHLVHRRITSLSETPAQVEGY